MQLKELYDVLVFFVQSSMPHNMQLARPVLCRAASRKIVELKSASSHKASYLWNMCAAVDELWEVTHLGRLASEKQAADGRVVEEASYTPMIVLLGSQISAAHSSFL
eukprot:307314-Amphidinium_carterae.2